MARTKERVRADHACARARGQASRRTSIQRAARILSDEQVEAALLEHEVRVPARSYTRACLQL